MSLKREIMTGISWTLIQQITVQAINFIVSVILARILSPSDFGLIALLSVFMTISNILVSGGMGKSLIRSKETTNDDYSTIFVFNILTSIVIYLILFITAPAIAIFYKQESLTNIIRIYAIVIPLNAVALIQTTRLNKEMKFKKIFFVSIPSILVGGGVGIVLAMYQYGVWSLVWSAIVRSLIYAIQVWIYFPWRITFFMEKKILYKHFLFGYKLSISAIIDAVFRDIYTILIGKLFDPIQVGFYNRANTLKQLPVYNFSAVLVTVTYPLFSKIQDDDQKLRTAYSRILQIAVFLISPTLLFMAALAEPLFSFIYTQKWLPAVPYFQLLCINGILYPIHAYNLDILTVKGRSDLFLRLEVLKKLLVIVNVLISVRWGIYGLIVGSIIHSFIALMINTYYTGKFLNYSIYMQISDFFPSIAIALTAAFLVYLTDSYVLQSLYVSGRVLMGIVVGILTYGLLAYIFKVQAMYELVSLVKFYITEKKCNIMS